MQLSKELELKGQLDQLRGELAPLERLKLQIDGSSTQRTNLAVWASMAFMSVQFGFLARLTWWEYSWDIMEPVTYFIGSGMSMLMFAYFLITRQVRLVSFSMIFYLPLSPLSLSPSLPLSLSLPSSPLTSIVFSISTQEYVYPDARDRAYLNTFHRMAKRHSFDIDRYSCLNYHVVT